MPNIKSEALVKPELLVWARETAGLPVESAAKKISIKPERLLACEHGQARLTVRQLQELGNAYKRPLAFFYLPVPPKPEPALYDFRHVPDKIEGSLTPELRLEIRRARNRRGLALDLYQELEIPPPVFEAVTTLQTDVSKVAGQIRSFLQTTAEKQFKLSTEYEAYNFWRDAIETSGVLVFQGSLPLQEMRGFSLAEFPLPVITINSKDHPFGRIFTLIHELTHIMLRSAGVCNLRDGDEVEVFCNAVAGETLVPSQLLKNEPLFKEHAGKAEWSDDSVKTLASRYAVSREVVLRRLLSLGIISNGFYQRKREALIKEYAAQVRKSAGGPSQEAMAIGRAGKSFSRLVIDSYRQEKISPVDASQYLGIKIKYLEKVEKVVSVFGGQRGLN